MSKRYASWSAVAAVALLTLALTSGRASAQYTSGIAMDGRGPYTNTYIAPFYAPAYAPRVPWSPLDRRYSPLLYTSINYPGVYGQYVVGIAALDYRGPVTLPDTTAPVEMRTLAAGPFAPVWSTAQIDVRLPADAELSFQGIRMNQAGPFRQFVTPPLQPTQSYGYTVRATWTENGQPVTQERQVRFRPEERVMVDFT
jgi:uncharacterized protein (TIGR03000 family)